MMSYCQLMQLLHLWINVSLQESWESSKRLEKEAAVWFVIPTSLYCKILLGVLWISGKDAFEPKPCLIPESSSDEGFVGCGAVDFLFVCFFLAACEYNIVLIDREREKRTWQKIECWNSGFGAKTWQMLAQSMKVLWKAFFCTVIDSK